VVGWDNIQPAADGHLTVVDQPYNGVTDHDGAGANVATSSRLLCSRAEHSQPILFTTPLARQMRRFRTSPSLPGSNHCTAPTYQWYKEGVAPFQADFSVLSQRRGAPADAGFYYVVVQNRFGMLTNGLT